MASTTPMLLLRLSFSPRHKHLLTYPEARPYQPASFLDRRIASISLPSCTPTLPRPVSALSHAPLAPAPAPPATHSAPSPSGLSKESCVLTVKSLANHFDCFIYGLSSRGRFLLRSRRRRDLVRLHLAAGRIVLAPGGSDLGASLRLRELGAHGVRAPP